jgi:regulator of cell morphogenesis and NO signaling
MAFERFFCFFSGKPLKLLKFGNAKKDSTMEIPSGYPISQIAIEMTEAVSIFEKYGIDYYKDGEKTLKEASAAAGVPLEQVESELKKKDPIPAVWDSQEPDWGRETMAALIHYIIHIHHVKTRSLLDGMEVELAKSMKGEPAPSKLALVRDLFLQFAAKLQAHMLEEEKIVFPYLIHAERALKKGAEASNVVPKDKDFSNSIRDILFEHRFMDRGFNEMEKLVYLFNETEGGRPLKSMAEKLKILEKENQKHIHLENNILLKRATQLGLME